MISYVCFISTPNFLKLYMGDGADSEYPSIQHCRNSLILTSFCRPRFLLTKPLGPLYAHAYQHLPNCVSKLPKSVKVHPNQINHADVLRTVAMTNYWRIVWGLANPWVSWKPRSLRTSLDCQTGYEAIGQRTADGSASSDVVQMFLTLETLRRDNGKHRGTGTFSCWEGFP